MLRHSTTADCWPGSASAASHYAVNLDSWNGDSQLPRPTARVTARSHTSSIGQPLPLQLDRYTEADKSAIAYRMQQPDAWIKENDSLRQLGGCDKEPWSQDPRTPMPLPAYHASPAHQRFASGSSGAYSGAYSDHRNVPPSEPDSDLSSDYSEFFQIPGLSFQSTYPCETREQRSFSTTYSEPQRHLPDFVVEELKRLKLENMALKRMAQEVVRYNNSHASAIGQGPDRHPTQCSHHPLLSTPIRLQRVLNGAEPMQTYREDSRPPNAASTPSAKPRQMGASASMWAPERRRADSLIQTGSSTPSRDGVEPARSSTYSAAELSRCIAMNDQNKSTFPGHQRMVVTENSRAADRPHPLSARSTHNSPGPASTVTTPKLEDAPASSLVAMVLDKRGQEASLLLQQQLKNASPERQAEIFDAICARIVPLSHDRHGNFLVQSAIEARCEIARHLKGAFVELTMSQFGCYVVQKALEGEEDIRESVTEELLGSRLDETLTSRHSIHVWQRILETEWSRAPFREKIFAAINRQLKGRWAQTARQETGSIICQNIFESARPAEKAQCVHEVLEQLDDCATNQWGVWVVQHIIEHGDEDERRAALEGLVGSAAKLTLSLYGQKAVMSGLKTGDRQFMQDYVEAMCHSSQPRRPPLIDVCLAPHGIQIVTQLLTTVDQKTRDRIISTVRRNSVFLKGSKTGMKVHQLCERARAFAGY